jgi:hypothetical protein
MSAKCLTRWTASPFAWIGHSRQVRLRERRVGEEGFARLRLAFHERDRTARDLGVDQPALLKIVDSHLVALLALASLHDLFRRHDA